MSRKAEFTMPATTQFDSRGLWRWSLAGEPMGWLVPELAKRLQAHPMFETWQDELLLQDDGRNPLALSLRLQGLAQQLREEGWIKGWRDEAFDYFDEWGRWRFKLERAAFRTLGLCSRAIHVNGYVAGQGLWLAQRSLSKAVDPGRLDNLAAGGVASGESPADCVLRELFEEAGVSVHLARQLQARPLWRSTRRLADGVHDEWIYLYELALPPDFIPHNRDGEVAGFTLHTPAEVAASLDRMTVDAASCSLDWLQRWSTGC